VDKKEGWGEGIIIKMAENEAKDIFREKREALITLRAKCDVLGNSNDKNSLMALSMAGTCTQLLEIWSVLELTTISIIGLRKELHDALGVITKMSPKEIEELKNKLSKYEPIMIELQKVIEDAKSEMKNRNAIGGFVV
jgi:hypothetical protein